MINKWLARRRTFFVIAVLFFAALYMSFQKIEADANTAKMERYAQEAKRIRDLAEQLLVAKMKTTLSLAVSLSLNDEFNRIPMGGAAFRDKTRQYLMNMRRYTPFKNVWLEVVSHDGQVLYRSWKESVDTQSASLPENGCEVPTSFLQSNEDDLLVTASVAISDAPDCNVLNVHTHFNSIAQKLAEERIDTVVVADENVSQTITNPFTKKFAGPLYVANFNAPDGLVAHIASSGTQNVCRKKGYQLAEGYLLTGVELKHSGGKRLGCMMLFERLDSIKMHDIELKALNDKVAMIVLISLVTIIIVIVMIYAQRRQKAYYKEIIDSSSNMIVVTDGSNIDDVNKTFFDYLQDFSSLEAFKKQHKCICDFFAPEGNFLRPEMGKENWVHYVVNRPRERHIAKLNIGGRIFYFQVKAARLKQSRVQMYSAVFTDITREYLDELELERISLTDPLTRVWNRRYFDETLHKELERSRRYKQPLSLLMIDIDHFKKINDRYGHAVGDKVLVALCRTLEKQLRSHDSFCRIGGEEFAVILPHATQADAAVIAERMRKAVSEVSVDAVEHFTVSIGVCECFSDAVCCFESVDKALYAAKAAGRNRVHVCTLRQAND